MKIKPIGFVKSKIKRQQFGGFAGNMSEIIIDKTYAEGLGGLDEYSHLIVVYWMNEAEGTVRIKHRPQGHPKVPEVGIFATRCQWRPNCIGISTVPIVSIKDNVVKVKGLDVIDNTPILDIKPYLPAYDEPEGNVRMPEWTKELVYK